MDIGKGNFVMFWPLLCILVNYVENVLYCKETLKSEFSPKGRGSAKSREREKEKEKEREVMRMKWMPRKVRTQGQS